MLLQYGWLLCKRAAPSTKPSILPLASYLGNGLSQLTSPMVPGYSGTETAQEQKAEARCVCSMYVLNNILGQQHS